jgi:hypothetical protein
MARWGTASVKIAGVLFQAASRGFFSSGDLIHAIRLTCNPGLFFRLLPLTQIPAFHHTSLANLVHIRNACTGFFPPAPPALLVK